MTFRYMPLPTDAGRTTSLKMRCRVTCRCSVMPGWPHAGWPRMMTFRKKAGTGGTTILLPYGWRPLPCRLSLILTPGEPVWPSGREALGRLVTEQPRDLRRFESARRVSVPKFVVRGHCLPSQQGMQKSCGTHTRLPFSRGPRICDFKSVPHYQWLTETLKWHHCPSASDAGVILVLTQPS